MFRNLIAATIFSIGAVFASPSIAWEDPPYNAVVRMQAPVIACQNIDLMNQAVTAMEQDDTEVLEMLFQSIDNKEPNCVTHTFKDGIVISDKIESRTAIKNGQSFTLHIYNAINPFNFHEFVIMAPEIMSAKPEA